jgi:hypothetical protein
VFPKIERVAVLCDAADTGEAGAIEAAAASLIGSPVQVLRASRVEEFAGAFGAAKRARAEALIVCASGFFTAHRKRLVDLAGQYRLAAIYENRDFASAGGLMSYGPEHRGDVSECGNVRRQAPQLLDPRHDRDVDA